MSVFDENDIVYRLAYRVGQIKAGGWPWFRKDLSLHEQAIAEIERLRDAARETAA